MELDHDLVFVDEFDALFVGPFVLARCGSSPSNYGDSNGAR